MKCTGNNFLHCAHHCSNNTRQRDYLVKARISEMASYRKLLGDILLKLPHVRESKSYIVMTWAPTVARCTTSVR